MVILWLFKTTIIQKKFYFEQEPILLNFIFTHFIILAVMIKHLQWNQKNVFVYT